MRAICLALLLAGCGVADPEGALLLRRAAPEYVKLAGALLGASALLPSREAGP